MVALEKDTRYDEACLHRDRSGNWAPPRVWGVNDGDQPGLPMRYDDLPVAARTAAARAANQFLQKHNYVSLTEACQTLDLPLQALWDNIMEEAGLPACDVPSFALVD